MNPDSKRRNASFAGAFLAGAASGACSTLLFQPFDVIKTRLQENAVNNKQKSSRKMLHTISFLIQHEGLRSLWAGLTPSLWRCVPGVAVYFTSIEAMKYLFLGSNKQHSLNTIQALTIGASSRTITAALLMPFTVIKTRFESGHYNYKSVLHALATVYGSEGGRGLMTGLTATIARDVPFSAIYFAAYSHLKQLQLESSAWNSFICGLTSGIFASVVTHPADVIKTYLQLFPSRYRYRTRDALLHVYKSKGVAGFFAGLMPRLVRRTLISAMSWTVYDKVIKSCESL